MIGLDGAGDAAEPLRLCQRADVLENGAVARSGDGQDLLTGDRVRQAHPGL